MMEGHILRSVADFEKLAAKKISPESFGFFSASAGDITTKDNREAYKRWRFRPRLLRNVSSVDPSTTVLGTKIPFPVCISPTANHCEATLEGEVATAKAAEILGIGMTLSVFSNRTMEDVAHEAPKCIRWCHIPVIKNTVILKNFMERAERSGFTGYIVTIDQAVLGKRLYRTADGDPFTFSPTQSNENLWKSFKQFRRSTEFHPSYDFSNQTMDGTNDWSMVDWIKNSTQLPVVLKGILTEEMALEAVEHGVHGIIVSNHGGRQLDGPFATIDSLPEVVKAVTGRIDVYLDGGISTGEDIVKAIALGAKAVFVGRTVLWGLAVGGAKGAQKVLEILRNEFIMTMRLLGVTSIRELQTTPNLVVHKSYISSKL